MFFVSVLGVFSSIFFMFACSESDGSWCTNASVSSVICTYESSLIGSPCFSSCISTSCCSFVSDNDSINEYEFILLDVVEPFMPWSSHFLFWSPCGLFLRNVILVALSVGKAVQFDLWYSSVLYVALFVSYSSRGSQQNFFEDPQNS